MWDESVETLLSKYCDEAQIRESLHRSAFYNYKSLTTCFQLPVIVLSALSGSLAFLSKSYPTYEGTIITSTASISILVSIISAVATYLKPGEQQSKNETSQVAWQEFHNRIKHELSLRRDLRQPPADFLKDIKTSYDRLFEISPLCSKKLIRKIKKKVNKHAEPPFEVPSYLNGWHHATIYRDPEDGFVDNED